MIKLKSQEELEDAAIADAVKTAVSLHLRNLNRRLVNDIAQRISDDVMSARHNGREVDVKRFMKSAFDRAFEVTNE